MNPLGIHRTQTGSDFPNGSLWVFAGTCVMILSAINLHLVRGFSHEFPIKFPYISHDFPISSHIFL